jgi:hypothetical protein
VVGSTWTTLTAASGESQPTGVVEYRGWPSSEPCCARHLPRRAAVAEASLLDWLPEGLVTCHTATITTITAPIIGMIRHGLVHLGLATRPVLVEDPQPGGSGGASDPLCQRIHSLLSVL